MSQHWVPRNKGKQEDQEGRRAGRQAGRQGFGKQAGRQASETSWETSWKTSWETREPRPREGGHTIQQREDKKGDKGRQSFGKADTPWETSWENKKADKLGDKLGDKTSEIGRETHHVRQSWKTRRKTSWETRAETSWETRWETGTRVKKPPEGGHAIQQRETRRETSWETTGSTSWQTSWETRPGEDRETPGQQREGKKDTPAGNTTGKQEAGRQAGRQSLGKTRRQHHPTRWGRQDKALGRQTQHGRQGETRSPEDETRRQGLGRRTHHPTKGNKKKFKEDKLGDKMGDKLGDKGDKALGRRSHHPTRRETSQGDKLGDKQSLLGRRTHHPTKGSKKEDSSWETRGETSWETSWRQGRQGLGKAGHTIQQRETRRERQAGRQKETRPREGGHTIQQREDKKGDNGDKGRQGLGKADTPSNKGKQEGRQTGRQDLGGRRTHHPTKGNKKEDSSWETRGETRWETSWGDRGTRPWEGGHTIQQRETKGRETLGDKADTPSNKGKQEGRMGDKGRQGLGKADTPSNKGKQEGVQWDNGRQKRDKTLGKADTPSNKGKQERQYNGRQRETRPSRGHTKLREGGHTIQQRETRTRETSSGTHRPTNKNKN